MRGKKLLLLLGSVFLVLMLVVPMMASCAGPAPSPTPSPSPSPTPSPTSSPSPSPSPPPAEKVYNWRMQSFKSPGDVEYDALEPFCDSLRRMSNGRLDIAVYPAAEVVPTAELLDSVAAGVVEIGQGSCPYWKGKDWAFSCLWGLCFTGLSVELWNDLLWNGGLNDIAQRLYAEYGVHSVAINPVCTFGQLMSTVPIYSLADIYALKVTTHSMPALIVQAVGGAVTMVPGQEIYLALATGVVDASMYGGASAFWALGLHEVAKYITEPGWAYPTQNDFFVNMDAWNELPDDLKEMLTMANFLRGQHVVMEYTADDLLAEARMQKEWGVTVCRWDEEALAEATVAALPFWDEAAAKSPMAAEVVNLYKDYMKEHGIL